MVEFPSSDNYNIQLDEQHGLISAVTLRPPNVPSNLIILEFYTLHGFLLAMRACFCASFSVGLDVTHLGFRVQAGTGKGSSNGF